MDNEKRQQQSVSKSENYLATKYFSDYKWEFRRSKDLFKGAVEELGEYSKLFFQKLGDSVVDRDCDNITFQMTQLFEQWTRDALASWRHFFGKFTAEMEQYLTSNNTNFEPPISIQLDPGRLRQESEKLSLYRDSMMNSLKEMRYIQEQAEWFNRKWAMERLDKKKPPDDDEDDYWPQADEYPVRLE